MVLNDTLNISSNAIGDSNDEINFPHKLLVTDTQVSKLCKVLENDSSDNIRFSNLHLSRLVQSGEILGLFRPLSLDPYNNLSEHSRNFKDSYEIQEKSLM